jgi:hypothetical protein
MSPAERGTGGRAVAEWFLLEAVLKLAFHPNV